jgi:hydroxyisourate hydrolase
MAKISTHVIDTAKGGPAVGVNVDLFYGGSLVMRAVTNSDGRTNVPLLVAEELPVGTYDLVFHAGEYFRLPGTPFLNEVVIRFGVGDPEGHYHVPLLVAPHGYSTYRGS